MPAWVMAIDRPQCSPVRSVATTTGSRRAIAVHPSEAMSDVGWTKISARPPHARPQPTASLSATETVTTDARPVAAASAMASSPAPPSNEPKRSPSAAIATASLDRRPPKPCRSTKRATVPALPAMFHRRAWVAMSIMIKVWPLSRLASCSHRAGTASLAGPCVICGSLHHLRVPTSKRPASRSALDHQPDAPARYWPQ